MGDINYRGVWRFVVNITVYQGVKALFWPRSFPMTTSSPIWLTAISGLMPKIEPTKAEVEDNLPAP